jgi:hypothetical protein
MGKNANKKTTVTLASMRMPSHKTKIGTNATMGVEYSALMYMFKVQSSCLNRAMAAPNGMPTIIENTMP